MATFDDTARMRRLLARVEGRLGSAFLRLVDRLRAQLPLSTVTRVFAEEGAAAITSAAFARGAGLEQLADEAAAAFAAEVQAAFILAGGDAARFLTLATGVPLDFDTANDRAVQALRSSRFRLIREFTEQQRGAVREALAEGTRLGINPRAQARMFRGSIGLTARQQAAVGNFERLLRTLSPGALERRLRDRRFDSTVRRAIASGEALTERQVQAMVTRYRQRYLKFRSETIARTEALRAVHESSEVMFGEAIERGALSPDSMTREWNTALDERVRGSHARMQGQVRALGEPFVSGLGNLLRFPGDPDAPAADTVQCRCVVGTRVAAPAEVVTG